MVLTKDPANSYDFKKSQEHNREHSSIVVHQLKHVDTPLYSEEKQKRPDLIQNRCHDCQLPLNIFPQKYYLRYMRNSQDKAKYTYSQGQQLFSLQEAHNFRAKLIF